jgi:mono/diheme cytochrome c family protein
VFTQDTSLVDPGSPPAEYVQLNQVCAQCHNGRGTDPADGALQRSTSRPPMHDSNQFNMLAGISGVDEGNPIRSQAHFNAPGQCSTCHMLDGTGGHTFTVKLDNCVPCHTQADAAARRNAVRGDTEARLLALRNRMENWAEATLGDRDFWDYSSLVQEAGKTPPDQAQVPIEVKRARHNYYFVIRDASLGTHNGTYTRNLLDIANRNLGQIGVAAAAVRTAGAAAHAIIERDRLRASVADRSAWE